MVRKIYQTLFLVNDMGNIIDLSGPLAGLLSLREQLRAADFEDAPQARTGLDEWNDRLDATSPWTCPINVLADLVATAPEGVDLFALGLLAGVLDTRRGTNTAQSEDATFARGYEEGAASAAAKAKPTPTLRLVTG